MVEEIMREKRMMHMLDIVMTDQAIMRKIMDSPVEFVTAAAKL